MFAWIQGRTDDAIMNFVLKHFERIMLDFFAIVLIVDRNSYVCSEIT